MKLLALDTSSLACSVALFANDEIAERHETLPREHTRLLLPMIREVLRAGGVAIGALDAIVLGNGPGSFIGLRIAASVSQGICHAAGIPLVPVSSLAAIAAEAMAEHGAGRVAVAQDARMREVYLGCFERDADGLPRATRDTALHPAGAIQGLEDGTLAAGAGWTRYPGLWDANRERLAGRVPVEHPRARFLVPLGLREFTAGNAIDPGHLEPAYVRDEVAVPAAVGTSQ